MSPRSGQVEFPWTICSRCDGIVLNSPYIHIDVQTTLIYNIVYIDIVVLRWSYKNSKCTIKWGTFICNITVRTYGVHVRGVKTVGEYIYVRLYRYIHVSSSKSFIGKSISVRALMHVQFLIRLCTTTFCFLYQHRRMYSNTLNNNIFSETHTKVPAH